MFRAIALRLYDFDANGKVYPELASALPTISQDRLTYTIPLARGSSSTTARRSTRRPSSSRSNATSTSPARAARATLADRHGHRERALHRRLHLKQRFTPLLQTLADNDGIVMSPTSSRSSGTASGPSRSASARSCSTPGLRRQRHRDQVALLLRQGRRSTSTRSSSSRDRRGAAAAALKAGDIQVLDGVSPTELPAIRQDSGLQLIQATSSAGRASHQHRQQERRRQPAVREVGTPLASSAKLRQAFEEAIDRNTLDRVVFDGLMQVRAAPPIPPRTPPGTTRRRSSARRTTPGTPRSSSPPRASRTRPCTC